MLAKIAGSLLLLLAVMRPADAAVVVALSLDDLVAEADAIVHARVVDADPRWEGRLIVTEVGLEVLGSQKGTHHPGDRVAVAQPGGRVGDLGMTVPGAPSFSVGDEVVVFLEEVAGRPAVVLGLSQGKFDVVATGQGPVVTRDLRGLTLFHPDADPARSMTAPVGEAPVALAPFLRAIGDREQAP